MDSQPVNALGPARRTAMLLLVAAGAAAAGHVFGGASQVSLGASGEVLAVDAAVSEKQNG
ncbi:MAG: hypothetical protein LLG01_03295 [Planctomycetaceae bacterium]|nr:hypothetical protein [Planctomycetaceae bacterium]